MGRGELGGIGVGVVSTVQLTLNKEGMEGGGGSVGMRTSHSARVVMWGSRDIFPESALTL